MLTTRYVTGSPNWVDLGTPDLAGATAFYHALFGWDFRSAGPDTGGYGMFQLNGRSVTGAMTVTADQGPSAWALYFQTADADATAAAVRQGGGTVVFEPMDVMDLGRMALFSDPAGAGFATWQPGANKGLDLVNEPGSLYWSELYTEDEGAAFTFYSAVFGWESTSMPMSDGGDYRMVSPAGLGPDGMFGGLVSMASVPDEAGRAPYWLPYFAVNDCDAVARKAGEGGGAVSTSPTDIEGVGRFAKLTDPYGARFAVLRAASRDA